MPPKKKDKSKGSDWLQCSNCSRLICLVDAESHSATCPETDSDHGFIQQKVLHGKPVLAEKLVDEEGGCVTKYVKDSNNTVWLSIQAMQICGLCIGQPCVVNRVLVRRAWPAKMPSPTCVGMTTSELELLDLNGPNSFLTVEKFQDYQETASSLSLVLKQPNKLFETEEFSSFTTAYLDSKFVAVNTPLRIQYFGQICECQVGSIITRKKTSAVEDRSPAQCDNSILNDAPSSTPSKGNRSVSESKFNSSVQSTPVSEPGQSFVHDGSVSFCTADELSESMSSLNVSNISENGAMTPEVDKRKMFPNLVTPVKELTPVKPTHKRFVKVISTTKINMISDRNLDSEMEEVRKKTVTLEDLGGLMSQIKELKSRIRRAQQPSSSSRCILIYGPAGTGKTMLVQALTADFGLHSIYVAGTDVWSKLFGEAESNLKKLFKSAKERAPSILVIDDIDVLCPRHAQTGQQVHRILGTFLSLIDSYSVDKSDPVVILGVTNSKDNMDPALLRAGRFGCEVEISVPTALQRLEILKVLLARVDHSLTDSDLVTVSRNAHGYVGADLAALVNEACMHACGGSGETISVPKLTMEDFVYAGLHIKPSALREIQLDIPEVRWSDIGGMAEVKMRLREAVELPLSNPEIFKGLGIEPPRGLLMYGPPGCSKTMVARALATECHLNFLTVKGPELFNQYVGESEKAIREVFRKARSAAPSVVFFDEIDAIAGKRGGSSGGSGVDDRVLTQLLTEMDGMETLKDVFVMAATNRPDKIDKALLRPGRFDSLVYVPLPDAQTRQEILEKKFTKMKVGEDVSLPELVTLTECYSGAEVIQVCQEAALFALRENLTASQVFRRHFDAALDKVQPQIDLNLLQIYHEFAKQKS